MGWRREDNKGLKGVIESIAPIIAILAIAAVCLISCSDEQLEPQQQEWELPIEPALSVIQFEEGPETRSWTPPSSYYLYDNLYDVGTYYQTLQDQTIDAFLTTNTDATLHGRLRKKSDGTWKFALNIDPTGTPSGIYYVYGFIPRSAANNATLSLLNPDDPECTYADGAVLRINGLKSIATDPCIIIGAKEGPDADHDGGRDKTLTCGDFDFYLNMNESAHNYMYLLFDHLYSAMCINMRVQGTYAALRTIKLKSLELRTFVGSTPTKATTDVTVTLRKKTDGSDPISSIVFTDPIDEEGESSGKVFESEEGIELTTSYSSYMGHFMPKGITKLKLTSTYDVYDKQGNLIRKNCTADNILNITELFSGQDETLRGRRYNISITIHPTYLYMMSEPDLKFEVES